MTCEIKQMVITTSSEFGNRSTFKSQSSNCPN